MLAGLFFVAARLVTLLFSPPASQNGSAAASLSVAEQYVNAFSSLAKETNTVLLPSNTGDVASVVAQVSLTSIEVGGR